MCNEPKQNITTLAIPNILHNSYNMSRPSITTKQPAEPPTLAEQPAQAPAPAEQPARAVEAKAKRAYYTPELKLQLMRLYTENQKRYIEEST